MSEKKCISCKFHEENVLKVGKTKFGLCHSKNAVKMTSSDFGFVLVCGCRHWQERKNDV